MAVVTDSQLKGNYAAAYVASRLSAECLVRPVAADTDIGVDLYCETVTEGRPFLHFWVQVKGGTSIRVAPGALTATHRFLASHLAYWERQPVPVFAALVPVDWPVTEDPDVHIINVTRDLLTSTLPVDQETHVLQSSSKWRAGSREDVRQFLTSEVPSTVAQLQCRTGVVAFVPTIGPAYSRAVPAVPVARFSASILNQLRRTAAFGILTLRGMGQSNQTNDAFRRTLAAVVAQFETGNWENFAARAFSYHVDEHYEEAVKMYSRAVAAIEGDANVSWQPEWQQLITSLKAECALAEQRRPPGGRG